MDLGAGAVFGAAALVLVLVLAGVYAGARLHTGKAPAHAAESAHAGDLPGGDSDVVPQEAGGGMPMVAPVQDPAAQSADEMQDRARRNA